MTFCADRKYPSVTIYPCMPVVNPAMVESIDSESFDVTFCAGEEVLRWWRSTALVKKYFDGDVLR